MSHPLHQFLQAGVENASLSLPSSSGGEPYRSGTTAIRSVSHLQAGSLAQASLRPCPLRTGMTGKPQLSESCAYRGRRGWRARGLSRGEGRMTRRSASARRTADKDPQHQQSADDQDNE